jgi:hypothetical protein
MEKEVAWQTNGYGKGSLQLNFQLAGGAQMAKNEGIVNLIEEFY